MSFNYCVIINFHKTYMSRITRQHKGVKARSQNKKSRIFKGTWRCWELLDSCLWSERRRALMIRKLHNCELYEAQTCAKTWPCIFIRPRLWSVTQATSCDQAICKTPALAPPNTDTHTKRLIVPTAWVDFCAKSTEIRCRTWFLFIHLFYLIASIQCGFGNLNSSVVAPQHNQWTDSVGHTFSAQGLSFG